MTIKLIDLIPKIEGDILTVKGNFNNLTINDGYVSDLLSDVMANAKDNQAWITIMKHLNSVAVASIANIPCIIFANGVIPNSDVIDKANEENICLLASKLSSFEIAGRLYTMLHSK